jgi:bifunctional DNA-binding transcriptional regulator/antitoxin component of YhaV-PrlF toxin-antitoxin module
MHMSMPEAVIDAKVRKWGNSIGVIIPKKIAEDLNIKPGETVHIKIEHEPGRNNADNLPSWDFVVDISDSDIDKIVEEELEKEYGG